MDDEPGIALSFRDRSLRSGDESTSYTVPDPDVPAYVTVFSRYDETVTVPYRTGSGTEPVRTSVTGTGNGLTG